MRISDWSSDVCSSDLLHRDFVPGDLAGRNVVFAASGDPVRDAAVSRAAKAAGIPVNVPDRPDLSSFIMPALIDRDPVVVGITTGGRSEEHTSELQSLMRISYAVFCLNKKKNTKHNSKTQQ